jgi:flagellar assembly protein FliH
MVAIAFEAVCKMLGDIAVTREGLLALIRQATTHVLVAERLVIRLHPADLSILQDAGGMDGILASGTEVSWAVDKDIALGGCVVEAGGGELDARLETQLESLRSLLIAARLNAAVPE